MTKTRKRILLLVKFKYRDLPGLALVKVLLEALGSYDVVLAPHVPGAREGLYLRGGKPDLVALPQFLNQPDVALGRCFEQLGIGVAVIPTEGTSLSEELRLNIAGKFLDYSPVDLFFIWNQMIADLVRTHRTVAPERCVVAGVPRFDFYHPRFRQLILSREALCARYAMDPRRPTITWATNFGFAWFAGKPAEIATVIKRYRTEYDLAGSPVFGDIPLLIEREVESRQVLTEGVLQMAREFPEANVVIKIHPAEERGWYQEQVARVGLKNIRVISQEYIWDVLNATDVHLHRSCTTAIEAWLLNKPTVDLQFAPREWLFSRDLVPGGDVAFSLEECLRHVRHYLTGETVSPQQRSARSAIIEWFCGRVDGQSALRHAEAIHAWLQRSNGEPRTSRLNREDLFFSLISHIKSLLKLQPHHSLREWFLGRAQDDREKYFRPEDEQTWIHDIRQVLDGAGTASQDNRKDFLFEEVPPE